jgi:hypothetical protein
MEFAVIQRGIRGYYNPRYNYFPVTIASIGKGTPIHLLARTLVGRDLLNGLGSWNVFQTPYPALTVISSIVLV